MMTQQGHCCKDCCDNTEHEHYYKKENIISGKADVESNGS